MQYCEESDWQDFGGLAFRDAQRLSKLMAAAADSLMPEPTLSTNLKKDVFDVLLQNVRHVTVAHHCIPVQAACLLRRGRPVQSSPCSRQLRAHACVHAIMRRLCSCW